MPPPPPPLSLVSKPPGKPQPGPDTQAPGLRLGSLPDKISLRHKTLASRAAAQRNPQRNLPWSKPYEEAGYTFIDNVLVHGNMFVS
jgi:hypothetical protein